MRFDFDPKAASKAAKRLRGQLARDGINLQHAKAVEAVAKVLNFENASAMRASLDADTPAPPDPEARIDHDTVESFLTAMETVIVEANYALAERESGVEDGLYEADDNPTDRISADISKVEALLPEIRCCLRALTAPARPAFDHAVLWRAVHDARHPERAGRITFHRDTDGILHADILTPDWNGDDAPRLRAMLLWLSRPDAHLPEGLLDVVQEAADTFRVTTTLDVDQGRDIEDVCGELSRALDCLDLVMGLEQGDDAVIPALMLANENAAAAGALEARLRDLYQAALNGDPTARRVFGFLSRAAPAYHERLVTELRPQLSPQVRRQAPDSDAYDRARLEIWRWLETGRQAFAETAHRRMLQVEIARGPAGGARWLLSVPDQPAHRPEPLHHLADLNRVEDVLASLQRNGRPLPLGFEVDTASTHPDGGLTITYSFARDH